MTRRIAAAAAFALLLAACGREAGPSALPQTARFCSIAEHLSDEAVVFLQALGSNPSAARVARVLTDFFAAHRAEYAELDRNVPVEIRSAVRRQRAAQVALTTETSRTLQEAALAEVLRNGRVIRDYEIKNCVRRRT